MAEPVTRLTPRGHAVAALAAGLIAAGAIAGPQFRGPLIAAWGFGLLVFLLAYRLAFAARVAATAASAKAVRMLATRPRDRAAFQVSLRVCTPMFSGIDLHVEDTPPSSLEPLTPLLAAAPAPPGGCLETLYRLRGRPGRHRWGPLRLSARDWLGLLEAPVAEVEPTGVREARIPPRPARLRGRARAGLLHAAAAVSGAARGGGTVFLELRDYMPDDDSRLIDWKASARTGRLLVKVFERETRGRVMVVADLECGDWGAPGATLAEAAARLAMGAVEEAARSEDEVKLVALHGGAIHATPWLRGPHAVRAAARLLSGLDYPAQGPVEPPSSCQCPPVPSLAKAAEAKRPALLVLVSGLGGGCRERARQLEQAAKKLRPAATVYAAAAPRPPSEALEPHYRVRAAAVAKAAAPRWLILWDDGTPL